MNLKDIYIRDPFILLDDGLYYLYGKTKVDDKNFFVYTSEDLENWSEPKMVFEPPENFWADRDFWAPEVYKYNDKYYMFASFKSSVKCRGTQILVADKPDGKFKPITDLPATPPDWECLDGTLYVDKKGIPYMVFCHEWRQIDNGTVCYARLSDDLTHFVTEPKEMFSAHDFSFVEPIKAGMEKYVTDGPFMHRLKNGELIMIWSSFGNDGYFVSVLKSDNGEIDGKWHPQNMLFDKHGGHGMLFYDLNDDLKIVFHSPNSPAGDERALILKLTEKDGMLSSC